MGKDRHQLDKIRNVGEQASGRVFMDDIVDFQRQDELIRQATKPEPAVGELAADALSEISESEIQSLSRWLSKPEPEQIHERLRNDDLVYSEVVPTSEEVEIIDVDTFKPAEVASHEYHQAATRKDDPAEGNVVIVEMQDEITPQESRATTEFIIETTIIDESISDIEASFETLEQEIVGELLIGLLMANMNNTYQKDEIVDLPFVIEDGAPAVPVGEQSEPGRDLFDTFTSYLEDYEPVVREQAVELIRTIQETVEELSSERSLTEEDKEQLIVELELTIRELFATLEVEIGDEQVRKYVELLMLNLENDKPVAREYGIDYLNKMGTREHKLLNRKSLFIGLAQTAGSQLKHIELIGMYTIQACLA